MMAVVLPLTVSCSSDDDATTDGTVQYGVAASWQNGTVTRSISPDDAPVSAVIDYVYVKATPKTQYASTLSAVAFPIYPATSGGYTEKDQVEYMQFHTNDPENEINKYVRLSDVSKYEYTAKAMCPGTSWTNHYSEPWSGSAPALSVIDYLMADNSDVTIMSPHILFTLQHQTAMLRMVIRVGEEYNKLRTFKLKSIKVYRSTGGTAKTPVFSDSESTLVATGNIDSEDSVLTTDGAIYLSFNVNPESSEFQNADYLRSVKVVAVYDVYDKGPAGDGVDAQITRKDCTAKNTLTLTLSDIRKGYYYNVITTLAPDFLYVLSDNDQQSDLVLK